MLKPPNLRIALLSLLCVVSIVWTKLAPAAGFLTLVVWLSTPRAESKGTRRGRIIALSGCVLLSSIGFVRFVLDEAIPGVIAGGKAAATKQAVSFGRTVVTAQDHIRSSAALDHDDDGVGSAVTLPALAGLLPTRSGTRLEPAPLFLRGEQLVESPEGQLIQNGAFLYKLCLPASAGGFTSNPKADPVDDELAERRFLVYGWPRGFGPGNPREIIFIDEHERILIAGPDDDGNARFVGNNQTPPCDVALREQWPPWKDKQPRRELPGDRS